MMWIQMDSIQSAESRNDSSAIDFPHVIWLTIIIYVMIRFR